MGCSDKPLCQVVSPDITTDRHLRLRASSWLFPLMKCSNLPFICLLMHVSFALLSLFRSRDEYIYSRLAFKKCARVDSFVYGLFQGALSITIVSTLLTVCICESIGDLAKRNPRQEEGCTAYATPSFRYHSFIKSAPRARRTVSR